MLIGIVGAPNKGKSTLFSALTMNEVGIADYPFTTIDPNFGVAYVTRECAEVKLSVKCNARNSSCAHGRRMLPVNIVDVAGLVEGAHEGRGMGNRFLNDLAASDALILVVDASGGTDAAGNPCSGCDPAEDVRMVKGELVEWLADIIAKHIGGVSRRADGINALSEILAGLKVRKEDIEAAAAAKFLTTSNINWSEGDVKGFASELLERSKPVLIAANKMDAKGAQGNLERLKNEYGDRVVGCSAAIELALRKAGKQGIVDYVPGAKDFNIVGKSVTQEQSAAVGYMKRFVEGAGTGVQEALDRAVFGMLGMIVVYPVEDENKYTDHFGNVLPDAVLLKSGSTAQDLAATIHSDIATGMLYAVDAVSKKRLAKDYVLHDNDVIRIVTAAKRG